MTKTQKQFRNDIEKTLSQIANTEVTVTLLTNGGIDIYLNSSNEAYDLTAMNNIKSWFSNRSTQVLTSAKSNWMRTNKGQQYIGTTLNIK
jgi:hypothetical protein